jgi:hypothetical protein
MEFTKIAKNLQILEKTIQGNEKLSVDFLLNKVQKIASVNPEDKTLGSIKIILEKMSDHNQMFITRKALNDLYNRHYTYLSRFAEHFKDELGLKKTAYPTGESQKVENKTININDYRESTVLDSVLASAFNSDSKASVELISNAEKIIKLQMASIGLSPDNVKVVDHNFDALVVNASFITPKGPTQVLIPLTNKLQTSVFVSNAGVQDITRENIVSYIKTNAGQKLKTSPDAILKTISASLKRDLSDSEIAALKIKTTGMQSFAGSILGQEVEIVSVTDVKLPRLSETSRYEGKLGSSNLECVALYGESGLKKAASAVVNSLENVGITTSSVKLSKSIKDGVMFSVASDTRSFSVPVKFLNKSPLAPEIVVSNGSILKIDASLSNSLCDHGLDKKAFIEAKDIAYLSIEDLVSFIQKSASSKEFEKYEAGMIVLKDRDESLYNTININLINNTLNKSASVKHKCGKTIKMKTSKYDICSHTGLPINKIAHDEYGNCIPLHRTKIAEADAGGYFMTAKILG